MSLVKTKKNRGGGGLSPLGKNQNRNHFVFFSFGVDPSKWQSFIEISEMACSTTAWCSRGHTLTIQTPRIIAEINVFLKVVTEDDLLENTFRPCH